jgi:hypothetical protein
MLDFIEFKAGQKQPIATYPFTERTWDQRSRLFPSFEGLPKNMGSPKERIATAVMSINSIIDQDFNHTRAFKSTEVLGTI